MINLCVTVHVHFVAKVPLNVYRHKNVSTQSPELTPG